MADYVCVCLIFFLGIFFLKIYKSPAGLRAIFSKPRFIYIFYITSVPGNNQKRYFLQKSKENVPGNTKKTNRVSRNKKRTSIFQYNGFP